MNLNVSIFILFCTISLPLNAMQLHQRKKPHISQEQLEILRNREAQNKADQNEAAKRYESEVSAHVEKCLCGVALGAFVLVVSEHLRN